MKLGNRCSYGRTAAKAACFLVAGLLLFSTSSPRVYAQQPGSEALNDWNTMRSRVQQRLEALKAARDKAQAALSQAQAALDYAESKHNQAAIAVSQKAEAEARAALSKADWEYSSALASLRLFAENLPLPQDLREGEPVTELTSGTVQAQTDSGWIPLPMGAPLPASGEVQTGKTGSAFFYLPGNHGVFLVPETRVRFEKTRDQGEMIDLLNGAIHVMHNAEKTIKGEAHQIKIKLSAMIVGEEGTEYSVSADGHVLPYSGELSIIVRPHTSAAASIDRWWQDVSLNSGASQPLPAGALGRILRVQSGATVTGEGASPSAAAAGALLHRGDRIETTDGKALVQLAQGYRAVISSQASFELTTQGTSDLPLYALFAGRLYIAPPANENDAGLRFMVPNAVVTPTRAEFAVSVDDGGLSDFVPLAGALDIRASDKRLDFSRIPSWWEMPQ